MQANSQDLKRLSRLKNRRDFLTVRQHNRKYAQPGLVLQIAPTKHSDHHEDSSENSDMTIRYGITVSTRVDKRAVIRNRIKRRLRSAARDILSNAAREGYDYVLIGRKGTLTRSYSDLKKDLEVCIRKLGVLLEDQSK